MSVIMTAGCVSVCTDNGELLNSVLVGARDSTSEIKEWIFGLACDRRRGYLYVCNDVKDLITVHC